ncbi:TlpA disulfide reductase family protein [Kordiimonas lacus]|uniref:AhpC/TSA family protein n=1 Tax=Kordiimonas lacus TaxID=637679 RepID=A0A1G6XS39_9PROT|nr:TlpA disulfide reductase family protein [Kordiimonas lacus]SDD80822.1 AhpC/TSA family protein [Kordiimonas lacus]
MRPSNIWIALVGLAFCLALPARADDRPIDAYLVGEMKGLEVFHGDLDFSDYKLVTGFKGREKIVEKLATKHGKVLMIAFWALACQPCDMYLKDLNKVQEALGDDRFEVVAIDLERNSIVQTLKALQRQGLTALAPYGDFHPSITQELEANPGFRFYGREPKTILVDSSGKVRAYSSVTRDWLSDDGRALIDALKDGKI